MLTTRATGIGGQGHSPLPGDGAGGPRLPQIIAVGPTRTGTTWLDRVLRGHVGLPEKVKEPNFFGAHYEHGVQWYAAHFRDCAPNLPIMEIGPTYFPLEYARDRIAETIPGCRILCTLREPVARLYSSYRLMIKFANWSGSFEDNLSRPDALSSSRYAHHLRGWFDRFGRENVLVVRYDDFRLDAQSYLDRICDFIGIAHVKFDAQANERINTVERAPWNPKVARLGSKIVGGLRRHRFYRTFNAWRASPVWDVFFGMGEVFPPLDREVAARVRGQLMPDIEELEALLGWDLSSWKNPSSESTKIKREELVDAARIG